MMGLVVSAGLLIILFITAFSEPIGPKHPLPVHNSDKSEHHSGGGGAVGKAQLTGHVIAPKLGNETAK